jgi:hypothetical protein
MYKDPFLSQNRRAVFAATLADLAAVFPLVHHAGWAPLVGPLPSPFLFWMPIWTA